MAINLIEVVWKEKIKELYANPNDYNVYMGEVMTWMGVIATVVSIFITGNVIRKFSWTSSAIIAPAITLLTGTAFFLFVLFGDSWLSWVAAIAGYSPLMLTILLGTVHNCMTRASKYTLFDATKEIAFVPLSTESKLKGKASIDGVGSRLGKSGGAVIHQGLFLLFSTVSASAPYIAILFIGVVVLWIFAVNSLGRQFHMLTSHKQKLDIPDTEPEEVRSFG